MSHGLCHWHRENLYSKELQRILEVFLTRMGLKDVESMETTFQEIPGIGGRVMNGVFFAERHKQSQSMAVLCTQIMESI